MKRRPWSDEHRDLLDRMYPHCPTVDVAAAVGRTTKAVYQEAHARGLRKTEAFLQSERSGRIQRGRDDPRMKASQFKSGQQPWNKGIKGSTGHHPNSRRTQFKKGRPASAARNYLPIGSERITKDGYVERKMTDDPDLAPARRWIAVHRLVWEKANGPIPRGHIVIFRKGLKTTDPEKITVDILELISRKEHAIRNHPRSRDPELAKLVQLKGAITRQVNRIARESKENKT